MSIQLRDYQGECKENIFHEWESVRSTLAVLFTGAGKTIIFASVITDIINRPIPKRVMILAGRRELIKQAKIKTERVNPGLICAVEMGNETASDSRTLFGEESKVVIATVQTLTSSLGERTRMSKFDPMEFGVLILDECHNCVSPSYLNVINYFKQNPDLKILGVTATPDRLDEEALGQICDSVAFEADILFGIERGWLVPIDSQVVKVEGLDFSEIDTVNGDLDNGQLADVLEEEENLHGMVHPTLEYIFDLPPKTLSGIPIEQWPAQFDGRKPKRTLIFTHSVRQAELISQILNRHVVGLSRWIHGGTPDKERTETLQHFEDGRCAVLVNCSVLFEGYDNPAIEIVVCAKPTKSRARKAQMDGRGTRPLPGVVDGLETVEERIAAIASSAKKKILIVDFTGNSGKHKLLCPLDILGGNYSDQAIERAKKIAEKLGKPVNVIELLNQADSDLKHEAAALAQRTEEARRKNIKAKSEFVTRSVNPFDVFDVRPARTRGWHEGKQLTEPQKAVLIREKIYDPQRPYAQQRQLLDETFKRIHSGLSTVPQIKTLKNHGLDATKWTKQQASDAITQIANNGWRLPDNFRAPTATLQSATDERDPALATSGQIAALKHYGVDATNMKRGQAGAILGSYKAKERKSAQEPLPF